MPIPPFLNQELSADTKLLVIGDIHEHEKQYFDLVSRFTFGPDLLLVVNGDVIDKGWGTKVAVRIIEHVRSLGDYGLFIRGNHENKRIRKMGEDLPAPWDWVAQQPYARSFVYPSGERITVLHAGVLKKHTLDKVANDHEVAYIRLVDPSGKKKIQSDYLKVGKNTIMKPHHPCISWHEVYDGWLGYIVAGHEGNPEGKVRFYKHSVCLDTAVFKTGILSAMLVSQDSKEIVQAKGAAYNPHGGIYVMYDSTQHSELFDC